MDFCIFWKICKSLRQCKLAQENRTPGKKFNKIWNTVKVNGMDTYHWRWLQRLQKFRRWVSSPCKHTFPHHWYEFRGTELITSNNIRLTFQEWNDQNIYITLLTGTKFEHYCSKKNEIVFKWLKVFQVYHQIALFCGYGRWHGPVNWYPGDWDGSLACNVTVDPSVIADSHHLSLRNQRYAWRNWKNVINLLWCLLHVQ